MLHNNYQNLEELRSSGGKCPRCSLCKFPPLVQVKSQRFSSICPSYEVFGFHGYSGAGHVVTAMSLLDKRGEITPEVKKVAWACTACGGCDMACKYNSDIEVQEIILMLRAHILQSGESFAEHDAILASLRSDGSPFAQGRQKHDWRKQVEVRESPKAPLLVLCGRRYIDNKDLHPGLSKIFALLHRANIPYRLLPETEPYAGRAAWDIGDRALAAQLNHTLANALDQSGARTVVCLDDEDYSNLRQIVPRHTRVNAEVIHIADVLHKALKSGKLRAGRTTCKATYHDASWMGRLSEPWVPWKGISKKVYGQLLINVPKKPVLRGSLGNYDVPREVLKAIPGVTLVEMERRREYAYDSGESGQAGAVFPQFALAAARNRLDEASQTGASILITPGPASRTILESAGDTYPCAPEILTMTDFLYEAVVSHGGDT